MSCVLTVYRILLTCHVLCPRFCSLDQGRQEGPGWRAHPGSRKAAVHGGGIQNGTQVGIRGCFPRNLRAGILA